MVARREITLEAGWNKKPGGVHFEKYSLEKYSLDKFSLD